MAATTTSKLIQLRPLYRPSTTGSISIHSFSSSSSSTTPDPNENTAQNSSTPPPSPPKPTSSFAALFGEVKATLKQQPQGNPHSQTPRSPFSFLSSSSAPNASRSSFKMSSTEEIEKNLAEFRRLSAVPIPSSKGSAPQSAQNFSLEELYKRNVSSSGEDSSSENTKLVRKPTYNDIAESLRNIRINSLKNQNERFGKNKDNMSLSKLKESLNLKPGEKNAGDSRRVIGGTDNLPSSIFGKEMKERGDVGNADAPEEFVRLYSHQDLGEKLKSLRPEKKGDWFSLQELSERLITLRKIDQQKAHFQDDTFLNLRGAISTLEMESQKKRKQVQHVDILRQLGRTPSFMLSPPKEHLVEKYFHPDNMSASEKLKLELEKVRDEFKMSVSDCGSARVQVAQLTTKIKHLSTVLHKKDKHSRKGLQGMVQKRKTLLKYLRRTDWESYAFVLSKLGLRDNPDYKN